MIFLNLAFLIFRITLRRRQTDGLRLSDFLIFSAFLIILTGTSLVTYGNGQEINYTKEHPDGPPDPITGLPNSHLDPVAFGFSSALKTQYGEVWERSFLCRPSPSLRAKNRRRRKLVSCVFF